MSTPPVTSTVPQIQPPDPTRLPVRTLGQDDFLKLLVAQLTTQDPLNPKSDSEFVAQMAQFSALEQSRAMQSDMAQLQANGMIGRLVELKEEDGSVHSGIVDAVHIDAGTPQVVVNGRIYGLDSIRSIEAAPIQN
jgi:flagellar basal-body rod modification protein FlgD